ncbi:hypothetical protein RND81_09G152400 [Saponaria officinalis]|uniref:BZIP domain-containing protein n=1 Tax=Saponaria officinalis TaxID=3572 RepID=A0AAW1IM55_SAPOF
MEENNLNNVHKRSNNELKMPEIDYDDDVQISNQELHSSTNIGEIQSNEQIDNNIFDDYLLRDKITNHGCTHFHTCNAPGPDRPHTHTCVHVHTKKPVPPIINDNVHTHDDSDESHERNNGRNGGNREAVRKYRLKRKAYTASLADELVKLRTLNQQLMQKLQNQVTLETELARLKCLLVDIRGRIEGEIGSFPYQKSVERLHMNLPGSSNVIPCNAQFGGTSLDGVAALNSRDCSACGFHDLDCMIE